MYLERKHLIFLHIWPDSHHCLHFSALHFMSRTCSAWLSCTPRQPLMHIHTHRHTHSLCLSPTQLGNSCSSSLIYRQGMQTVIHREHTYGNCQREKCSNKIIRQTEKSTYTCMYLYCGYKYIHPAICIDQYNSQLHRISTTWPITWRNVQWDSLKTITASNSQSQSDNGDLVHTGRKTYWEFSECSGSKHWLIHKYSGIN